MKTKSSINSRRSSISSQSTIEEKLELTKACIHCGMCLPACPTYLETSNEGNSPRGRLYIIRDFIEAEKKQDLETHIKPNEKSIEYLDYCLSCRACETACPSGVGYHSILEYIREDKELSKYNKGLFALIRKLAFKNLLPNRKLMSLLRIPLSVISSIYEIFPFLPKLSKVQPELKHKYQEIKTNHIYYSQEELNSEQEVSLYNNFAQFYGYPKEQKSNKLNKEEIDKLRTIMLPTGCVMDTIYNHVHWDTIGVLNKLGFHIYIPPSNCCGALASHSGETDIGHQQLDLFFQSIESINYPIAWNSAGCGAFTKEHATQNFQGKIFDLIEIINMAPIQITNKLTTIQNNQKSENILGDNDTNKHKLQITYHPACHLNHAQNIKIEYQDLLKQIPNLEIIPLYEADVCCGSAGFYNLIKSKMAEQIGKRKAHFIQETGTHTVVTANPGCMSQIQAHLGNNYEVIHPISLLKNFLQ